MYRFLESGKHSYFPLLSPSLEFLKYTRIVLKPWNSLWTNDYVNLANIFIQYLLEHNFTCKYDLFQVENLALNLMLFLLCYSAMTEQLAKKYQLPIKSAYNTGRGFYLQIYTGEAGPRKGKGRKGQRTSAFGMTAKDLPSAFIKVAKYRNTFNFTTLDLLRLNSKSTASSYMCLITRGMLNFPSCM